MILEEKKIISPSARVMIYIADKEINENVVESFKESIGLFLNNWMSHNESVDAHFEIKNNRIFVFFIDEEEVQLGGCAIDNFHRFLQQVSKDHGINLFDRFQFAYKDADGEVIFCDKDSFKTKYADKKIDDQTLVLNSLVNNLSDFQHHLFIPLGQSWHKNLV
ncbi:MAG: hypothetical protein KBA06_01610 [Saprospiraceae bacterium]|nr:hypothetical protein [Saprospiraceae bacterium]